MSELVLMQQQAVANYGERSLTAADVRAQVNLIQDVMRSVMLDGTHYGKIPGTQSTSLYKAGAEKLMATFRLAAKPEVTDLSSDGEVHYRVTVNLLSAGGQFLGAGIGECSSREEKYAWRGMICQEEFDATPENRRRIKFAKWQGKVEQKKQVRTNPADVANTILKMAKKRAQVDAVITVTAASDIFTQDIEDLPEELRDQVAEDARARNRPAQAAQPDSKAEGWINTINAATTLEALTKIREDSAADYGDIKNVPPAVRSVFSARKAAILAATEGEHA